MIGAFLVAIELSILIFGLSLVQIGHRLDIKFCEAINVFLKRKTIRQVLKEKKLKGLLPPNELKLVAQMSRYETEIYLELRSKLH